MRRLERCHRVGQRLHLALQFGIRVSQVGRAGGHLRQALVQLARLAGNADLLLALLLQLRFQLLDLQLERFAAVVHVGFAGDHLAGNVLQTPRRFFTDARKAFLRGNQLLAHQGDLLKAPPGKARKGDQQRAHQCPQRAGRGALDLDHRRIARAHGGSGCRLEIIIVPDVSPQAGNVVEIVFSIVTHESTLNR